MKKLLLSLAFIAATITGFAADFTGTIYLSLTSSSYDWPEETTKEDMTLKLTEKDGKYDFTFPAFTATFQGNGMDVPEFTIEGCTATTEGGETTFTGSCAGLLIGNYFGVIDVKGSYDLTATLSGGKLSVRCTGTTVPEGLESMAAETILTFEGSDPTASALPAGTYFFEDFEWLDPWAEAGNCGETVANNNPDANSPQIKTPAVDGVTALQALEAKGYVFSRVTTKTAGECIYLNRNYLKMGKTSYQAGVTLPSFTVPADTKVQLTFDWCTMRQGSGTMDPTKLLVEVVNDTDTTKYAVPGHGLEANSDLKWIPVTINLSDVTVNADTKITIRNADDQWPSAKACRWFIDNIKVSDAGELGAISDITVDTDENAPVEYFNIQGVRVNGDNLPAGLYIRRQGKSASKILVK